MGQSAIDTPEWVRRYLRAIGPAVAGSGRSHATVLSACLAGHDFGLDLGAFFPLLDEWNGANQPPLGDRETTARLLDAATFKDLRNEAEPEDAPWIADLEAKRAREARTAATA